MKYIQTIFLLMLFTVSAFAQESNLSNSNDSMQIKQELYFKWLAEKFSQTRKLNISYNNYGSTNFKTYFKENYLGKNEIENTHDVSVNINLDVLKKKKWKLTYSGYYNYQNFEYDSNTSFVSNPELHYLSSAFSITYFSVLNKKPIIYNASLIADASGEMFGRIKGLVSATYVLKADKKSVLTIGLGATIDPTNPFPVFPIVTYTKPIFNGKWRLDMVLPAKIMLQTQLGQTGRVSLGSELGTSSTYFKDNQIVNFANKFEFRQTHIKSGITYEYLLKNKIVLTAKAGVLNVIRSRVSEKGESFSDNNYLLEFKPTTAPYINLGVSFNPF